MSGADVLGKSGGAKSVERVSRPTGVELRITRTTLPANTSRSNRNMHPANSLIRSPSVGRVNAATTATRPNAALVARNTLSCSSVAMHAMVANTTGILGLRLNTTTTISRTAAEIANDQQR